MKIEKALGTTLPVALSFSITASLAIAGSTTPSTLATEQLAPYSSSLTFEENGQFNNYHDLTIVEGDIFSKRHSMTPRGISRSTKMDRWPNGIAYYTLDPDLTPEDREKVLAAIDHWNTNTTISIVERTSELEDTVPDYITIESDVGCASWVGKIGGPQDLWVGSDCTVGSLIHEIGHAIGMFHEHTRIDRNDYITIMTENIVTGKEFNFDIMSGGVEPIGEYDYDSIMHYGQDFFSKNGNPTISVPDGVSIGQREALSELDKATVDFMYGTDLVLANNINLNDDGSKLLDVFVTNNGTSGAHGIVYTLPLSDDVTVASTDGSDWECTSTVTALICHFGVLPDSGSATLSITLNNATDDIVEKTNLSSKTFDTDLSNNGAPLAELEDPDPLEPNPSEAPSEPEEPIDADIVPNPGPDPNEGVIIPPDNTPENGESETPAGSPSVESEPNSTPDPIDTNLGSSVPESSEPDKTESGGGGAILWLLFGWVVLSPVGSRRIKSKH